MSWSRRTPGSYDTEKPVPSSKLSVSRRASDRCRDLAVRLNRAPTAILEGALAIGLDQIERDLPQVLPDGSLAGRRPTLPSVRDINAADMAEEPNEP